MESSDEFWESYFEAKEKLEADEAALNKRVQHHVERWGPVWEEVFRKVQELEEED